MEELLNKLIEKGWKPRGKTGIDERDGFVYMNKGQCIRLHKGIQANNMLCGEYNLRELVSKESGLWQFVCENKIQKERPPYNRDSDTYGFTIQEYQYRLIESALTDEDKLEDFILDNVKID